MAHAFLRRLADRNADLAGRLEPAVAVSGDVAEALTHVAGLFPYEDVESIADELLRREAVEHLRIAREAEARLRQALAAITRRA